MTNPTDRTRTTSRLDSRLARRIINVVIPSITIIIQQQLLSTITSTVERWQTKAITIYNHAVLNHITPPHQPEPWWTQPPLSISTNLWISDYITIASITIAAIAIMINNHPSSRPRRHP